jgi:hypothetical protein
VGLTDRGFCLKVLRLAGVSDEDRATAAVHARETIASFLKELEKALQEVSPEKVAPALGIDPRQRQLANSFFDARRDHKRFRSPLVQQGLPAYQVFVGKDAPFNGMVVPSRFPASFPDGTANTFLVVEAAEAVPWTKPQDVPYDARKAVPKLGGLFADGFHAAMADGTVRFVPRGAPEKAIRAAITPRGGEAIEPPGTQVK